jgi:hypothetical protein
MYRPISRFYGRNFLVFELLISMAITIALYMWVEKYGGKDVLSILLKDKRGAVYSVLIGVDGSLLGFVIATVAILLGFDNHPRMTLLRESSHYKTLWKVFKSAMRYLAVGALVFLIGLLFDTDNVPNWKVFYACFFVLVISSWRVGRCIWVLHYIIKTITRPAQA